MEKIELKIPNLGEAESTKIIEVNIEPGKEVSLNDPLIVLESEKAAMEIPSDFQGQIKEVLIKEGDEVSEGMVFATMEAVKEETHIEKIDEPKIISQEVSGAKKTSKLENSKIEIVSDTNDIDPSETKEWLESLSAVLNSDGKERAQYIIRQLET